jgi:hypothetical protein
VIITLLKWFRAPGSGVYVICWISEEKAPLLTSLEEVDDGSMNVVY